MIKKMLKIIVMQQGEKDGLREIMRQDFGNNLWKVIRMRGVGPVCITIRIRHVTYNAS
jgi:hypothetical protein